MLVSLSHLYLRSPQNTFFVNFNRNKVKKTNRYICVNFFMEWFGQVVNLMNIGPPNWLTMCKNY